MKIDSTYSVLAEEVKRSPSLQARVNFDTFATLRHDNTHDETTIVITYRKEGVVAIYPDDSVRVLKPMLDMPHETQRRINDILRPRGWALVIRDGHPFIADRKTREKAPLDCAVRYPNNPLPNERTA